MNIEHQVPDVTNFNYKETGKAFDFVCSDGKRHNLAECEAYFIHGKGKICKEKMRHVRRIVKARIAKKTLK